MWAWWSCTGRRSFTLIYLHTHSACAAAADSLVQNYNHEHWTIASFVLYCFPWFRAAADLFCWFSLGCASSSWFMAKGKEKHCGWKPESLSMLLQFFLFFFFPNHPQCWVMCFAIKVKKANKCCWLVISKNVCPHNPFKDLFFGLYNFVLVVLKSPEAGKKFFYFNNFSYSTAESLELWC